MILFYFLIFTMPLAHHRIFAAFVGDFTVIKYIGSACLPFAFLHLSARRSPPGFFRAWHSYAFVFLVSVANASFLLMGPAIPWAMNHGATYISFLLLFVLTVIMVDSLPRLRWALLVTLGGVGFASLHVIREWELYHNIYPGFRPGIIDNDPNYFTATALLCLPLAFYLMQGVRPKWERLYCLGFLIVTFTAVTLAASRGGLLGIGVAFLFVALRSGRPVRNLALAAALLLPITLVMPSSPWERLLHPSLSDLRSTHTRQAVWRGGWRMFKAHPIVGIGMDRFMSEMGNYVTAEEFYEGVAEMRIAHNSYIDIAAEMGLVGLVPFLCILAGIFQTLEKAQQKMKEHRGHLLYQAALGLQGGMLGFAVTIFFISGQSEKVFWLFVFLTMCMPSLVDAELARLEAEKSKAAGNQSPVGVQNAIPVPAGAVWRTRPLVATPAGRNAVLGERPQNASPGLSRVAPAPARKF